MTKNLGGVIVFFRNEIIISEGIRDWLSLTTVKTASSSEEGGEEFLRQCEQMGNKVFSAENTGKIFSYIRDDFDQIIIRVALAKSQKLETIEVVTQVYFLKSTPTKINPRKKQIYVVADEGEIKRVSRYNGPMKLFINGGDYVDKLDIIQEKVFHFSVL